MLAITRVHEHLQAPRLKVLTRSAFLISNRTELTMKFTNPTSASHQLFFVAV